MLKLIAQRLKLIIFIYWKKYLKRLRKKTPHSPYLIVAKEVNKRVVHCDYEKSWQKQWAKKQKSKEIMTIPTSASSWWKKKIKNQSSVFRVKNKSNKTELLRSYRTSHALHAFKSLGTFQLLFKNLKINKDFKKTY